MSLCFSGPGGTIEQRWIVYALLRDNVQHHLEGGRPTPEFGEIHRVASALGAERVVLNARRLRAELERARASLLDKGIADLAVSHRTLAVIEAHWPPPETEGTMLVSGGLGRIPWLNPDAASLDQVFGHLVRALLAVAAGADGEAVVEVYEL